MFYRIRHTFCADAHACFAVLRAPFSEDEEEEHRDSRDVEDEEGFVDSGGQQRDLVRSVPAAKLQVQTFLQLLQLLQDQR